MKTLSVTTGRCMFCGKGGIVHDVPVEGYKRWMNGAFIQVAFPTLSAGDREQLLTGTHDACFDKMMPEDEDESEPPF